MSFVQLRIPPVSQPKGVIFEKTVGEQSDEYDLQITPMGWAFSIWGVIFLWNFIWFGYGFAAICRKGKTWSLHQFNGRAL